MVKPLDATPSAAPPADQDNNVHNVFIKDILGYGDKPQTSSNASTSEGEKDKPTSTAGTPDRLQPRKSVFHFGSADLDTTGRTNPNLDVSNIIRRNLSDPHKLRTPLSGGKLYPEPDNGSVRRALGAYRPQSIAPVSYLDLNHPMPKMEGGQVAPAALVQERPPVNRAPEADVGGTGTAPETKPEKNDETPEAKPETPPEQAPPPKPLSIKGTDGKTSYERTEGGAWQFKDKNGKTSSEHADFPGKKITDVETQPDGSVKITIENGKVIRERPEGGRIHYADDAAFKANHPSEIVGKSKDIVWEGDRVKSFYSQSAKTRWYQVADDVWSDKPDAKTGWNGKIAYDGVRGTFIRTQADGVDAGVRDESRINGIQDNFRPDGSMQMEIPYNAGGKVTFKFKEGFAQGKDVLTQPEEYKITNKAGVESVWKKVGANEYQSGDGTKWKVQFTVNKDGTYEWKDVDTGERFLKTKQERTESETPENKTLVVKEAGKFIKVKVGNDEFQTDYDADGKPVEYRHLGQNLKLTKNADGTWTDAAIDGAKPFTKLPQFEKDMYTHADLDPFQKMRMSETLKAFRALPQFNDVEKDKVFKEADRLLKGRQDSAMTSAEKANYADQLFWQIVNDTRNEQGPNGTCSVTSLRGMALKEKPWVVARVAADIANDGQLTVQDGSVIKPKIDSVRVRPGSPEDTFPPKTSGRTALGKLWDVATVNISLQRDTIDPTGVAINKGSLSYEEVAPTGQSDSGARIIRKFQDGTEWVLYSTKNNVSTPYDSPRVGYPSRIADIWHQLTGETLVDKYIVHENRWVDNDATFKKLIGKKQNSEADLEAILKKDGVKVCQGNTGVLEQRYRQQLAINAGKDPNTIARPAGGEHIFCVGNYDAKTKTVSVDNSWPIGYDHPNKAEAQAKGKDVNKMIFISLTDLYDVIRTQTAGDSSTISWFTR